MSSTSKMQKNIQEVNKELAASRAKMEELAREMAILMIEIENENLNEEELQAEYAKATREEKNKRLEEECHICTEIMNKKKPEELFICGVCKNMVHSDCGEQWFQENKSCPFCRAAC